jgi:hypothetical protein
MANFHRRFLPGIARTLAPLTGALKGGRKGPAAVEWSTAMQTAFQAAKEALYQASTLVHPDSTADLSLMVDASETHVGAVLQQRERGSPRGGRLAFSPISYSGCADPLQRLILSFSFPYAKACEAFE